MKNTDEEKNSSLEEKLFEESMEAEEYRRAAAVQADLRSMAEGDWAERQAKQGENLQSEPDSAETGDEDPGDRAPESGRRERSEERREVRREGRRDERREERREERSYAPERKLMGNDARKAAIERREYEEDYQDYKRSREAEERTRQDRLRTARRTERMVRRSRDDDEEEYRKEYYGDRYESEGREERWRKKKKKTGPFKMFLRVLLCILLVGILLIGLVYLRIHGGGSDFLSSVKKAISGESAENSNMDGYTNIALFGVDSITESLSAGNNRSDVNMILSINNSTKECKLVSVYRDTYLDIGNATYTKCNAAYAYGGPAQAVAMLNQNFDLAIEDYATIGFGGIADIIDAVGGVEIDVQQDEISYMNDYQSTMAAELGKTYVPVTAAGTQTLTGLQATAYCRIRYTEGGDYHRTERQREVLTKTFSKLKSADAATDAAIMMKLIGNKEIETSLSPTEIMELAASMSGVSVSDTAGVPTEDLRVEAYVGDQACIIPYTLQQNVVWLHQYLFGENDYQVSETVQAISNQIEQNTGY